MERAIIYCAKTGLEATDHFVPELLEKYCKDNGYEIVAMLSEPASTEGVSFPMKYAFIGLNMEEDVNTIITLSKDMIGATDETVIDTLGKLSEYALYCKDASKKVRAAKAVLAKQGKYIAAFAPFGYQKSEDDKHMLVPNPVTAPVVRLIFELATKGMKYTEIANYLNDNGYDSIFEHYQKLGVRRCYERDIGQHMWSPSTVMGILYNEVYIGSVINNKTADNIDTGHQVVQRDKEDWIIVENCHEPLVSVEDFKLAHKMIARREKSPRKPNGKWRKSYLRCGVCGKGLNKYGNGSSYRCREGHVSRIRGEEIEQAVLDVARKMAVVRLEEFEIQMNKDSSSDDIGQEIESLKKAKAHYAKLKFEIYDDYTRTNITREQMAKKTAEVKNKIAELDKMIAEKQELFDLQKDLFVDAKQEIKRIISKIVSSNDKEQIERFADYRNYMNYEILVSNDDVLNKAKLSKQSGYNSGAEVQIPYMLILLSALLMIYNDKTNSTRLVFIDEPFAKMDPTNVRTMLKFMKSQKLQMIFCAPDKTELIGNECQVILPVLRTKPDLMEIGIVEIHEGVSV